MHLAEKVVESLIALSTGVDLMFKNLGVDFRELLKRSYLTDNTVLDRALEINVRRMHYIALISIPLHLLFFLFFLTMTPDTEIELRWRSGIMTVHLIYIFVQLGFAIVVSILKRKMIPRKEAALAQYAMIASLAAMSILLVTIDQYVTTNITPFMVLCIGISIFFVLRPRVTFGVFVAIIAAYYLSIGIVQKEPNILLSNRVNGITFAAFGVCLSLILWNSNRKNLFQEREIERQRRELEEKNSELERLAYLDTLTGLYNRRKWLDMVDEEVELICRYNTKASIILMDLDNFKDVNDEYGHPTGDRLLERIADILKENLRVVDKSCRWGGEEFIILLPQIPLDKAIAVAEKLRVLLEETEFSLDDIHLKIKASFGVASLKCEDEAFDMAYGRADRALYKAKNDGRNLVVDETALT